MNNRLSIFPAAEADVDAAAQFIARDNLAAALRFYDCVARDIGAILQDELANE
jgi:plasmid stabilization system protein ParE